jgi:hypothetical protein
MTPKHSIDHDHRARLARLVLQRYFVEDNA